MKRKFKGVGIGAGYFSDFQYEAWSRIPNVHISAISSLSSEEAEVGIRNGIKKHYQDYREMIEAEQPDFVDIITPPQTHVELCKYAADKGLAIICQKPLAPTLKEAEELVAYVSKKKVPFMVHENWRFQPWYRTLKEVIAEGIIGDVHSAQFRSRMGDGWGDDAYLARQPYFRDYPRLLVYENGIHFIDTFRYLFGEVSSVFAKLSKLNPVISGEDKAVVFFEFENDIQAIWDANRYNEPNYKNPRYTFGEMLVEGMKGSLRLYPDGKITVQKLGQSETVIMYDHPKVGFAGDSVFQTQQHFIECLFNNQPFETNGQDYLKSIKVQEAVYESSATRSPVFM